MAIILSRGDYNRLVEFSASAFPQECCGLLFGHSNVVSEVALTPNVACNPEVHFEIDPAAIIAAEKRHRSGDLSLLGYFHSHPNGLAKPSRTDSDMAGNDGRCWLIIANESITAWVLAETGQFDEVEISVLG